ncbi:MAG: glutamine synthetase adenylyltransferase [Planctomycetota bacterium]|nr:glutamine synthetase adenylyltransferase [Planctomycetota bacterium]
MFESASRLLGTTNPTVETIRRVLGPVGFEDCELAFRRLRDSAGDVRGRRALAECLPMLLSCLTDTAAPNASLVNFERYVQNVPDRVELFEYLAQQPRSIEILVRLFVSSQFLTEILLRNPSYLQQLARHDRLAERKSRGEFHAEGRSATQLVNATGQPASRDEQIDALRRYQHWEFLRIGACDAFGLMDFKSLVVQLSLLADALVQCCLELIAQSLDISLDGFVVLAFGKLGGEELNYSSDIDLVFLTEGDATAYWPVGQGLVKALSTTTADGFLYRVDMRLRPWGRSGALVNSVDSHLDYLREHGLLWERQALIKARPIAGDHGVGQRFLSQVQPLIYTAAPDEIRKHIQEMKTRIEANLRKRGRDWGEVKSGAGSIRDIEFVTQFLQMTHGGLMPEVRSFTTLNALVRLTDCAILHADEYQHLSTGYVFLRTIEHALQLMHGKQTHSLPTSDRELAYFARRLDFAEPRQFVEHYERHCEAIRRIYDKYISRSDLQTTSGEPVTDPVHEHLSRMLPDYSKAFTAKQIARHSKLRGRLTDDNIVELDVKALSDDSPTATSSTVGTVASDVVQDWLTELTIVGFDQTGDLSMICGLLFAYGFDIVSGHAFTDAPHASRDSAKTARQFVDVFIVRPTSDSVSPEVWTRYARDLRELLSAIRNGRREEAQGALVNRVAGAFVDVPAQPGTLYSVDIEFDNTGSADATILLINAEDTRGFLYELTNALSLTDLHIERVIVDSTGVATDAVTKSRRVFDTLYVTQHGRKITDLARQHELRAAIVLIKHFTHLLPRSSNPEVALLQFRDFLQGLMGRPGWNEEFAKLERSDVLDALAQLLGVSTFLWEDFLRVQHENLFPVVTETESLAQPNSRVDLEAELATVLDAAASDPRVANSAEAQRIALNEFKDRQMFRADMRHILGHMSEFGEFSRELTELTEVVACSAYDICFRELADRYGRPLLPDDRPCRLAICALGKCGGRELGFASDIELMFVFEGDGRTSGSTKLSNQAFFVKLIEQFSQTIRARQDGIFHVDLRLRPYGNAGSLAVPRDAFAAYFGKEGPAWPYERQALVKLRPIGGDASFHQEIVQLRDGVIYRGEAFDVAAMRGMREKQVGQHVQAGTINAKLSPGGLVACEYLVQGLQITHGHLVDRLRATNTRAAIAALADEGILTPAVYADLDSAYVFHRRLIDALRMVRGNAKDLTVPHPATDEFEFLARRLGYAGSPEKLSRDLDRALETVRNFQQLLDTHG